MKKPNKKEIISGIQLFLIWYTMLVGFLASYLWMWVKCGLPIEWWAVVITMGLAFLSWGGLCHWIWKGR